MTAYCERSTTDEPTLCRAVREYATKHPQGHWTSGPIVGTFLEMLVSLSQARRVLDIGTFFGYSAIYMASANPQTHVLSLEADEAQVQEARGLIAASPLAARIQIEHTDALGWFQANAVQKFDLIFFDSARRRVMQLYEPMLNAVAPGGVLVMDNACVRRGVLAPVRNKDFATLAFNQRLQQEKGFLTTLLPIRDGILLAHRLPNDAAD